MAIYRGAGGSGDAVNDAASEAIITIQARDAALAAQAAAEAAQTAAELAETNAETAETNAETAETNAETAATNAASSASAASTSASNAATSATNAANSATAAQTAETNAETAETNAAASASAASTSASNAATSATNASNSASAAATSATNSSNSASAAATSATNAANSATAAQTAQTAAELAETNAETAEANAETAETNAAASASAAATSATNASNSASAASTSATNASNSASAAATSATNASNSASAAATSASNAATSESNAATSASNAAASYDSFDDRYLGAKSSAPTLDNDGNALLTGALYFNTSTNEMKVWSGSAWLNAYASLSGALLASNNLSDLTNTATARTNLGVAIGTNVQAWDADLDTWATKTAPSGTVVGTSDSQTLTNKTLTAPVISTISNTGTLTLPISTDTLVGRATSDTLTNKTIALGSNTVSGTLAQFNTAVTDADLASLAGSETLTNKTISGASNTLSNIGNSSLTNSSITINGTPVSLGGSTSVGTVTSVTGTSPVASSGGTTPAISLSSGYGDTQNPYASKTANNFLAAPNGTAGVPTFRAIVAADIPTLNQNTTGTASNVTGTVAIANGGTGATTRQDAMDALAGAVTSGQYLRGNGTDVVMSAIQAGDVPTLNQNTTGSAATLTTGRTIGMTGDVSYTSGSFNGSANVTGTATLATVNSNVGTFGSASSIPVVTVNGKGLVTAVSTATVAGGQYFGSAATKAIAYNANSISENVTVTTGNNGLSAGPITINSTYTVTVETGAVWVIV